MPEAAPQTQKPEQPPKAMLTQLTNREGLRGNGVVKAHFNPETLQMTIRNAMEEAKSDMVNGRPSQLVASSEVGLSFQLIFDMTTDGHDVRNETAKIAEMMKPGSVVSGEEGKKRPSRVQFKWNAFVFEGLITDYSETLDYFSPEGIPLRSTVDLSMTKYDAVVPPEGGDAAVSSVNEGTASPTAPVASGDTVDSATGKASPNIGSDSVDREKANNAVARANGIENKKNPDQEELAAPDAAFAERVRDGAAGSPLSDVFGPGDGSGDGPLAFASGDDGFGVDLGRSTGGDGLTLLDTSQDGLGLGEFAGLNGGNGGGSSFGSSLADGVSFDGGAAAEKLLEGANIDGGQFADIGREISLNDIIFQEDA